MKGKLRGLAEEEEEEEEVTSRSKMAFIGLLLARH
jgi:hypothetical protein